MHVFSNDKPPAPFLFMQYKRGRRIIEAARIKFPFAVLVGDEIIQMQEGGYVVKENVGLMPLSKEEFLATHEFIPTHQKIGLNIEQPFK